MSSKLTTAMQIVSVTFLGMITGAIASIAAIGFVEIVFFLNDTFWISPRSRFLAGDVAWLVVATVAVPTVGGLIVGLLHQQIPERRAHGPADVIRSVQGMSGEIPPKSGFLSAISSIVSLGAGASVGQYGPLVHLGATLGSLTGRIGLRDRWMIKVGVACGVAAAISTAFNAPIAGIIFAHEVILRHYSLRAFAPVTVAASVGYLNATVIFEQEPLFGIGMLPTPFAHEYLVFILIGVVGAIVAVIYMRAILASAWFASRTALPDFLKPAAAGAVIGLVAIWLPDILGIGKETLRFAVIESAFEPSELALLFVAKLVVTALCIGFGFAGGVFGPALLIGILFGALVGSGAEFALGDQRSSIAIYAVCGMVAVSSAVIGAPLSTIMIVFELTRNYDLATAAMISVVFSNLVSYRVFGRSLFDIQLSKRGFDLRHGREKVLLENRRIADYVTPDWVVLMPDSPLRVAQARILDSGHQEGHVIDENGNYVGTLRLADIVAAERRGMFAEKLVYDVATRVPLVFSADTSVWTAMEELGEYSYENIPVIRSSHDQYLLGVVPESAVVRAYLDLVSEIRKEESSGE